MGALNVCIAIALAVFSVFLVKESHKNRRDFTRSELVTCGGGTTATLSIEVTIPYMHSHNYAKLLV